MTRRVLLVEDDPPVRDALVQTLELADLDPLPAGSFVAAKDLITADFDGVILSDMRMPGRDGFHLLEFAQEQDPDLPVVLLTGEGDIPMAVRAMTQGAFGFLEKPCAPKELLAVLERALKVRAIVLENRLLKARAEQGDAAAQMIFGVSEHAERLRQRARDVAAVEADVLVSGHPGAGTANVAEVIHKLGNKGKGPFIKRAAAELSVIDLGEATASAAGGTLFLDEIALLPPDCQLALLEWTERPRDASLIAGTYRDLAAETEEGRFSHDLRLRLETVAVRIPPLRDRPDDVPTIFRHYVARVCAEAGRSPPSIGEDRIATLLARDWPGNSRELMTEATRFALGLDGQDLDAGEGLAARMALVERVFLADALRAEDGQASAAAKRLGLPRKTFYDKLARHGLKPDDFR